MDGKWSSDLSAVKVGDWICTCRNGWTRVANRFPSTSGGYPILTESGLTYTIDGKRHEKDSIPVAFSKPPKWLADMVRPKPCSFEIGDKVLVSDSGEPRHRRYFSHIDAAGKTHCFANGLDGLSNNGRETKSWKYCKKFELK